MAAPGSRFGEQLQELRRRAGLTQAELAERANLSVAAVTTLERGVRRWPHPRTVEALADGLGARSSCTWAVGMTATL
jgi:transcriptional regulator with XRE-family HTH domain